MSQRLIVLTLIVCLCAANKVRAQAPALMVGYSDRRIPRLRARAESGDSTAKSTPVDATLTRVDYELRRMATRLPAARCSRLMCYETAGSKCRSPPA
jgi:hypothetical protein